MDQFLGSRPPVQVRRQQVPRAVWIDLVLLAVIGLACILSRWLFVRTELAMGRENRLLLFPSAAYKGVIVLMVLNLVLAVVLIGRTLSNLKGSPAAAQWIRVTVCVLAVCFLGGCIGVTRPLDSFLQGFAEWADQNVDVAEIRAWRHQTEVGSIDDPDLWPPAIRRLEPSVVWVEPGSVTNIVWGGGLVHWNVEIRPPGTSGPEPAVSAIEIGDGVWVYVW